MKFVHSRTVQASLVSDRPSSIDSYSSEPRDIDGHVFDSDSEPYGLLHAIHARCPTSVSATFSLAMYTALRCGVQAKLKLVTLDIFGEGNLSALAPMFSSPSPSLFIPNHPWKYYK